VIRSVVLSAALLLVPYAANAAELPVPKLHKMHRVAVHRTHRARVAHTAKPHFGYYFGHWGWRWGGTARSWYGSTFVFAGASGLEGASVIAASPKGVAAIDCPDWRPDVCLAEPVLAPVAAAAGWMGRQ
jgi:hypothetical protein